MVLISKAHRRAILEYLFQEGVLTVKKDGLKKAHDDIKIGEDKKSMPNLHVMMVMKSLASKGFVKYVFNWQWFYYYLTDEGITALREELHLPKEVSPATLTKPRHDVERREGGDRKGGDRKGGDRKGKGKGKGGWGRGKGEKGDGKGYSKGYGKSEEGESASKGEGKGSYGEGEKSYNNWGSSNWGSSNWGNNNWGESAAPAAEAAAPAQE